MISSATNTAANKNATSGAASAQQPGGAMGKNQFLKLLITQMKNQDPMNPMQGDQMAAQLAQFSSLEQLQQINENLTNQSTAAGSLLGAVQANAAIGTIGHHIVASGNQIELGGANGATNVTADIGGTGGKATLRIYDANGKVVGERDLGTVKAGRQTFDIDTAGNGLSGKYTYGIDVKDADDKAVSVQTYMTGRVSGISSGSTGLVLNVGAFAIPYSNVIQVQD